MATITKHIGKMKDAGTRVAVVFRTLPEEKDSALVVSTDNLPSLYHDAFIDLIDKSKSSMFNKGSPMPIKTILVTFLFIAFSINKI